MALADVSISDERKRILISAMEQDKIIFDYGKRPLVMETGSILDYLAAIVQLVKDRVGQMNFEVPSFEFRMASNLWGAISELYACVVPDPIVYIPIQGRAELRAKQSIIVDDMEYPVKLDEDCLDIIFFTASIEEGVLHKTLTATLLNVSAALV